MKLFTARTRSSRRWREHGVAAVEFALVVPILMSIIIGIVEFGLAFNYRTQLNNATQIAARSYAIDADWNVARANVIGMAPGAVVDKSLDCNAANVGKQLKVTTTVTRPTVTKLFGTSFTYQAVGVAQCS
ncbi:pilus assembly protein [Aeromicrobium sp. 636]|uniref:Pilus assembly protein n=1 Tax=Aeromicrobium senzhongii TaxID=2663859 RepID=A0A8I0EVL2_9ACTN|nr:MULTISPECIES: TadE family protein [Aeromicrobium]MBC9226354.1 pilus assembly protein [Aeromicrobium senzhongii]MCQ3998459.1 pilus assembly protein [Aeromicrobium sp. 636]